MSKEKVIMNWKNPMFRQNEQHHPAGNVLEELKKEEMEVLSGGFGWGDISKFITNKGYICTITKECACN